MKDTDIYSRITTEQVLEIFKYYDAARLKAQQTKLSGAATQLEKLTTGPLRSLLEPEESALIKQAGELIRSLNLRVEHAKEVKKREEKKRERLQQEREVRIRHAIQDLFPVPEPTADGALAITALTFGLRREKIILDFMGEVELVERVRRFFDRAMIQEGRNLRSFTHFLHDDIVRGVRDYMDYREDGHAKQQIQGLLDKASQGEPSRVKAYGELIEHIATQLAIDTAENVERLPIKKKR